MADVGFDGEEEEKADGVKREAAEGEDGVATLMEQEDTVDAASHGGAGKSSASDFTPIFALQLVNSYASSDYGAISDTGEPIKFESK